MIDLVTGTTYLMERRRTCERGATGGLLDGLPVVCGEIGSEIHSIITPINRSKFLGQLSVKRYGAASVALGNSATPQLLA